MKMKISRLKKIMFTVKYYTFSMWVDLYYDIKWSTWALFKYFKIVTKMRPWDYSYILQMQKFQIGILMKNVDAGYEETISKNNKVEKMKRWIELCDNHINDNYSSRCGYLFDYEIGFELIEDTKDKPENERMYEMVSHGGTQTDEERRNCIIKAQKLAEDEWNEMNDIIKGIVVNDDNHDDDYIVNNGTDARGWWN